MQGKSKSFADGGPSIGSDTVAAAIRAAAKDKKVKGILIRVNSGGGER